MLQPNGNQSGAGDPQKLYHRKFAGGTGIPEARFADHGVCELAAAYGNSADVLAAGESTLSGDGGNDPRISRRIFAARAAGDRARSARRYNSRGGDASRAVIGGLS